MGGANAAVPLNTGSLDGEGGGLGVGDARLAGEASLARRAGALNVKGFGIEAFVGGFAWEMVPVGVGEGFWTVLVDESPCAELAENTGGETTLWAGEGALGALKTDRGAENTEGGALADA